MDLICRGKRRIAAALLAAAMVCPASPGVGFAVPATAPVPDRRPGSELAAVPVPAPKPDRAAAPGAPSTDAGNRDETAAAKPVPCLLEFGETVDLPAVAGDNGCGFSSAVRLAGVNGEADVSLVAAPTVSCRFAGVLSRWVEEDLARIAVETTGARLKAVHTGPGYQCRRRNNLKDGKLSEHALGNALDVLGFEFQSGDVVSVGSDWAGKEPDAEVPDAETRNAEIPEKQVLDKDARGKFLHAVHASACKRFTTVLGPEADEHHQGHIHVDIGCHGKDCTYRICQ